MASHQPDDRSIAQAAAQLAAVGETIEVLALTGDESLLATLRQAVGSNQRIWQAVDRDQAVELIMAGRVGVIVVDEPATDGDCGAFCEQLRDQFPDLVLIVAGGVDDQTHLVKQITSGEIYRFLHKPVSTPRARQFIEAAMRRHLEGRTFSPEETAPRRMKLHPKVLIGAGIAVAVLVVVTVGILSFGGGEASDDATYRQAGAEAAPQDQDSASVTVEAADAPASEPDALEPAPASTAAGSVTAPEPRRQTPPAPTVAERTAPQVPASQLSPLPAARPNRAPPAAALPSAASQSPATPTTRSIPAPTRASPAGTTTAGTASNVGSAALLARANQALAQGQLVTPRGANAFELYSAVLASDPRNFDAAVGLDKVADQLLGNVENALLEGRIDDAARDIEAARTVRPNNVRIAFLSAQLEKERERRVIAQAREAAARGQHDRARTLIDRAVQAQRTPSAVLLEVRKEMEALRRGANVDNYMRLASERLRQNRLVEPANDNARHYIEAALAADPQNATALQARRVLADQLLARGRQAIAARDPVRAGSWLSQAEALGVERAPLRAAQRDLQTLRQSTARGDQISRLAGLITTRVGENRLNEPAGDNALHYLQELRTLEPNGNAAQAAAQNVGARLAAQSRQAIAAGDLELAQRASDDARRIGYADAAAVDREVTAARERVAFLANVVPANGLPRVREVAPRYPAAADRRRIEGWVDLEFTIATDGIVKDLAVRGSQPAGVFEDAATRAISQWVYRPVMRDGRAVEQRARLRLRFDVADD